MDLKLPGNKQGHQEVIAPGEEIIRHKTAQENQNFLHQLLRECFRYRALKLLPERFSTSWREPGELFDVRQTDLCLSIIHNNDCSIVLYNCFLSLSMSTDSWQRSSIVISAEADGWWRTAEGRNVSTSFSDSEFLTPRSTSLKKFTSCIIFYTILFPNNSGLISEPRCIFHGACSHADRVLQWWKSLSSFQHTAQLLTVDVQQKWASIHLRSDTVGCCEMTGL